MLRPSVITQRRGMRDDIITHFDWRLTVERGVRARMIEIESAIC